jgi:nitrate reductase beta subunit
MKIRAQIGMVLNLDKCIGCHTCSVTCKNVWTSRPGVEYAWFNNVETKPGIGYPKEWENQDKWNGGWVRKADGSIEPRQGGKWKLLMRIFANPNLPQIDDYYEPFTFDYDHLQSAPESKAAPTARPRSLITGKRMEKIEWGPNWEEILGGEFSQAQQGQELRRCPEGHLRPVRKHLHDVPAAPVRALPEPGLRGIVPVGLDLQARGRRHRADRPGQVPRLAHVRLGLPLQEDLLQLAVGQGREVHLLLPAHRSRPAHRVLETCVGRIRYLGVLLYDADRIQEAASVERDRDLYQAQLDIFLDPNDPEVIEQARIDGIPDSWMEAARNSPVYKMAWNGRWPCRCTPSTARCPWSGTCRRCRPSRPPPTRPCGRQWRHPRRVATAHSGAVPGQPADRRRHRPVVRALERMLAMRAYQRDKHVEQRQNLAVLKQAGLSMAEVEEMYHVMAIANYEDRFVIPAHREYAENAFDMRGGCGFSFGNGCSDGATETSMFGGKKPRTIPIKATV